MSRRRDEAVAYLLGELGPEEAAAVRGDAATMAEVDQLRGVVAALGEVPAATWDALPAPAPRPRRRRLAARLAAATALLVAGVVTGAALRGGGDAPLPAPGPAVALRALGDAPAGAAGVARMTADDHMLVSVHGLPRSARGEFYELWLLDARGRPAAVASFRVGAGGRARLEAPLPGDAARYRAVDVSVERSGGPAGHSGHSVLRGTV